MQGLGYREFIRVVHGQLDADEALRLMRRDTLRYARRQWTWFAREPELAWIDVEAAEAAGGVAAVGRLRERAMLAALQRQKQRRVDVEESLEELAGLAAAAGATVGERVIQERQAATKQFSDPTQEGNAGEAQSDVEEGQGNSAPPPCVARRPRCGALQ